MGVCGGTLGDAPVMVDFAQRARDLRGDHRSLLDPRDALRSAILARSLALTPCLCGVAILIYA